MNEKLLVATLSLALVFTATVSAGPVLNERSNAELEFLIENASKDISRQEAIVHSLSKRYGSMLKRKIAIQQFIDQENKKIEELKLSKSRSSVKPINAAPVSKKPQGLQVLQKAPKESPVLRKEKEHRKPENVIAKRDAVLEEVLKQQAKNVPPVLKSGAEKKKTSLAVTEEQKQSNIREESLKRRIAEQEVQLRKKENKIKQLLGQEKSHQGLEAKKKIEIEVNKKQQAELKACKQEQEELSKKLEKERLLAAQQQQRLIGERECQIRLALEADKNAKHERYVSQLGQLLNRQNFLLEETKKLESQIHQEEETLKTLEKTRQDVISKLLENS
jgi:hypothetical protein